MAGDAEDAFESYDVFLPGYMASLEGLAAVRAQVYLWLEVYFFCSAVVFRFLHPIIYMREATAGLNHWKSSHNLRHMPNVYVVYGHMVFLDSHFLRSYRDKLKFYHLISNPRGDK